MRLFHVLIRLNMTHQPVYACYAMQLVTEWKYTAPRTPRIEPRLIRKPEARPTHVTQFTHPYELCWTDW